MGGLLVTGAGGQLGRAVVDEARQRGLVVTPLGHGDLPIEDAAAVAAALAAHRPELVVHCAAWTDVDGCERDPARAAAINGEGAGHVAAACREHDATLVHVSTDFVFDGSKAEPYAVDDAPAPLSEYGRSKRLGEQAVQGARLPRWFVVRTSWVFGPGGRNFPRAILQRARTGQPLRVVDDQVGSPTMTRDLAVALLDLAASDAAAGIYHATNDGSCSWHRFAEEVLSAAGLGDVPVARMSSAELDRPARRPAYSVLDCAKLTAVRGRALPHYTDALARYLAEEQRAEESS